MSLDWKRALTALTFMLGLFVLAFIVLSQCACSSPQAKSEAAAATFLAEQLKCVDDAPTKASADACREGVRQQWAKDGGK